MKLIYSICAAFSILILFSCRGSEAPTPIGSLPEDYSNQYAGFSGADLITDQQFTQVNLEILYMPGYKPDTAIVLNAIAFIDSFCNKPKGVAVRETQIEANGKTLGISDVMNIEATNRTGYNGNNSIAVCIMITDGNFSNNDLLGIAYRNTSIALFGKPIYSLSGGVGQVDRVTLESAVLNHDLGHLFSLVGMAPQITPSKVNHQDDPHGNHCRDTACLMYYINETAEMATRLKSGVIPQLDSDCRVDILLNGGK
jgi:hypothetical protein